MTTITNTTVPLTPSPSALATAAAGAQFIAAAGIMGRAMNPLGASPLSSSMLPSLWAIAAFSQGQAQPAAQWTATTGAEGQAAIDLGDGYTLDLNENSSSITIKNANTGETTQIYGDPHVNVDGQHAFDFWGTTTFTLENGTKITINTEQGNNNPDVYYASQLVITKGDQAIVVDGISEQTKGDLAINMSNNGRALDAANRDGYELKENADGSGWISDLTNEIATQDDLNATKPGQAYGPGSTMPSVAELSTTLSNFLILGAFTAAAMELDTSSASSRSGHAAAALARALFAF